MNVYKDFLFLFGDSEEFSKLTPNVRRKMKFRDSLGVPFDHEKFSSIASLNDKKKLSFRKIADILEKNIEQYFTGPA